MTFDPVDSIPQFLSPTIDIPFQDSKKMAEILDVRERHTASVVNNKESGVYPENEIVNSQSWFTQGNPQRFRQGFRTVFTIGAIAPGATFTLAHGLTIVTMTNYWAQVITNVPDFRAVPYASVAGFTSQIEMNVTTTNIVIKNGAAAPAIVSGIAILEYLKT
jgi:hypothetical protein